MADNDIRWKQRLENYTNALGHLAEAVDTRAIRELSRLEAMGLVQAFECTYELGWNLLKDYLTHQGITDLVGSRDTVRAAVSQSILSEQEGTTWMAMLTDRNRTSHLYDEESIRAIEATITAAYFPVLRSLREKMAVRAEEHQGDA